MFRTIQEASSAHERFSNWLASMAIRIGLSLLALIAIFAPQGDADHVLFNGEVLTIGQNLTNGEFQLSMQADCNLVLYDNGEPTWTTHIKDHSDDCYLALKHTGELVVRRDLHYTLWSSVARSKKGKYALVLDNNGGLSVYGTRRWASNNPKETGRSDRSVRPVATEHVLYSGHRLTMGRRLVYGEYELGLDGCNMVIENTKHGKVLWQTNTKANGCYLQLEHNGELMLKHVNQKIWASNRKSDKGDYVAVLRFDGRLAVYGPLIWSNNRTRDPVQMEGSSVA